MEIKLSDHFTYRRLLRFTIPSIAMMILTSAYVVVDGFFVSNFAGKTALAAVNFIYPVLAILGSLGFMLGTGGSALIAKTMGEGDIKKARSLFSLLVYLSAGAGLVIGVLGAILVRPIASGLGAEGEMLEGCVVYGRILMLSLPFYMLQFSFQSFCVTAEKPKLGLIATLASGITNVVLDALLVAVIPLGVGGAALATALGQMAGAFIPLLYFIRHRTGTLFLGRAQWDGRALGKVCVNGSSEFMSNVAMPVVSILYNLQLMKYAGEDGVAAYGVIMYVCMIFLAIYFGYTVGSAPIVSYHYGAENHKELKNIRKKSYRLIAGTSLAMLLLAELLAKPLTLIFVGYDPALTEITLEAFRLYSLVYLFAGTAIYSSGFFTALNNGLISALISFLRTLVFEVAAVLTIPVLFGIDGIWLSAPFAELAAALIGLAFLIGLRKRYHY